MSDNGSFPVRSDPAEDIDRAVLASILGRSKMSAISRELLALEVAHRIDRVEPIGDRAIRQAIERLRQTPRGSLILSSSGGQGYWMADSFDQIQSSYEEERRRSLSILARIRTQRDLARRHFKDVAQVQMAFEL